MDALPLTSRRGMWACIAALTWALAFAGPLVAAAPEDASILPSDDRLREAIREGYERSETFRVLVDHLRDHRATVHVRWAPALTGGLTACLLHRVAVGPDDSRLLWILVRNNEPTDALVALIAHELQHVHEALDASVSSGEDMARVFEQLGERSGSHGRTRNFAIYDTKAAHDVEDQVARELRSAPSSGGGAR